MVLKSLIFKKRLYFWTKKGKRDQIIVSSKDFAVACKLEIKWIQLKSFVNFCNIWLIGVVVPQNIWKKKWRIFSRINLVLKIKSISIWTKFRIWEKQRLIVRILAISFLPKSSTQQTQNLNQNTNWWKMVTRFTYKTYIILKSSKMEIFVLMMMHMVML